MERLHSYWRMEYITAPKYPEGENPFVALPKLSNDREAYIVQRGEKVFLMLNRFPYNAGHLLVAPYREVSSLGELDSAERSELMNFIVWSQTLLQEALRPDGFNIGFNIGEAAGAGIPSHLHCHVVPRWAGDTNFMPVVSDTRVLPESLDAMWSRLREVAKDHPLA